jgi:hypothetical protein
MDHTTEQQQVQSWNLLWFNWQDAIVKFQLSITLYNCEAQACQQLQL